MSWAPIEQSKWDRAVVAVVNEAGEPVECPPFVVFSDEHEDAETDHG